MPDAATPRLIPTTVVGSHALPGWLYTAIEAIDAGRYGPTDVREAFDDAVRLAIDDQERAGVDIVSDGEMRRWHFVQSFYRRMTGIEPVGVLRRTGPYGYDSVQRYRPLERVSIPRGLGIVEEYEFARKVARHPLKVACPGPLTLTIHIQLHDDKVYKDRLELAWEFADVVNAELKALVAAGATFIQVDEPSYAIIPGSTRTWIELFNRCVEGVDAKIALHICFGNLGSRPRGRRDYGWMFPELLEARADQLVFEYANREMKEVSLWKDLGIDRELGAGVIDIKSFHVETPEDVAARLRELLKYVPAEKMYVNPDCGFFQLPRWLCVLKLRAMVAGAAIVRRELTGEK